jgi:hypothetical protein
MSVPRGRSITDLNARMAATFATRRATATVTTTGPAPWSDPTTDQTLPGGLFYPGDLNLHTVTVQGTFSGTLALQGSADNATFQTLLPTATLAGSASSGAISAPGIFVYQGNLKSLRVDASAWTSGTATVLIESSRG